tara:strand:- start:934 stop:1140 length:207 start_codon:yes stop_codon:yes gene_type:complete
MQMAKNDGKGQTGSNTWIVPFLKVDPQGQIPISYLNTFSYFRGIIAGDALVSSPASPSAWFDFLPYLF